MFRTEDLGRGGLLHGLDVSDLLLCHRGSKLVGILAGWDQQAFRQNIVCGYRGALRWTRPMWNAWAGLAGLPKLPAPGHGFRSLTAALPLVVDNNPQVFATLLGALLAKARAQAVDYLLLGLHETDPLWPFAKNFGGICYTTLMFIVCWDDGEAEFRQLDRRVPYLELGSL